MTGDVRQTAQERFCDPIVAEHEQDTTSDGTGPQNGPEGPMESLAGLRAYVRRHARMDEMTKAALQVYAREIEREVGGYAEMLAFCKRTQDAAERREDVTLWGVDYTALPVDADGEVIHIGDMMEWYQGGNVFTVTALHLVSREWEVWGDDAEYAPDECRHHHEPTVEDVLREFAYGLGVPVADSYVAATAAKLRLAGDE